MQTDNKYNLLNIILNILFTLPFLLGVLFLKSDSVNGEFSDFKNDFVVVIFGLVIVVNVVFFVTHFIIRKFKTSQVLSLKDSACYAVLLVAILEIPNLVPWILYGLDFSFNQDFSLYTENSKYWGIILSLVCAYALSYMLHRKFIKK